MNAPIVPQLHRLMIPARSGVTAVLGAADQVQVRIERLMQEIALRDQTIAERDEEIAELKRRVEELESALRSAAAAHAANRAYGLVEGLR